VCVLQRCVVDILLIDDDERFLKTINRFLRVRGHGVQTAMRGDEGLDRLRDQVPDLVICDVRMPGMDGLAFLEAAHKTYPSLPVVLVTAYRELDTAISGFRSGAFDFLKKPFRMEELEAVIEKVVSNE
jgi:DNA-binding NtrC family response regulator